MEQTVIVFDLKSQLTIVYFIFNHSLSIKNGSICLTEKIVVFIQK